MYFNLSLNHAPLNGQVARSPLFNDLNQVQFRPGSQFGSPSLTVPGQFGTKGAVKDPT
jgi:hypothetical protein